MQVFCKTLGEAIGQRFQKDRLIVIVCILECFDMTINTMTGGDSECTNLVNLSGFLRRNKIT